MRIEGWKAERVAKRCVGATTSSTVEGQETAECGECICFRGAVVAPRCGNILGRRAVEEKYMVRCGGVSVQSRQTRADGNKTSRNTPKFGREHRPPLEPSPNHILQSYAPRLGRKYVKVLGRKFNFFLVSGNHGILFTITT